MDDNNLSQMRETKEKKKKTVKLTFTCEIETRKKKNNKNRSKCFRVNFRNLRLEKIMPTRNSLGLKIKINKTKPKCF